MKMSYPRLHSEPLKENSMQISHQIWCVNNCCIQHDQFKVKLGTCSYWTMWAHGCHTDYSRSWTTVLLQCSRSSKSTKADQRCSVAKQRTELCQRDFSQSPASFRVQLASDEAVTIVLVYSAMAPPPPPPPLPLAFYNVVLHNELQ